MVEQTVRAIAEAIAAGAPDGWTHAELHARAGRGGSSATGGYLPRAKGWNAGVTAPHTELMALAEALRQDRGWDPVSMEFRCLPSGEYRFAAFSDAVTRAFGTSGGFEVVLDPGYRLPQPGVDQPASGAGPAGDAETAAARFRAYLERRAAILGHPEELPPPATEAELDEAERRLGRRLPPDLRALYGIADGDGIGYDNRYLFQGCAWLPLKSLVAEHEDRSQEGRPWYGWDLEWEGVVFDATPPDTVRRCGDHPGWLRFATPEDGNYLAVDMDPAAAGRPGQVIWTGRDHNDGPGYVADSLTSLLGHYLDLLDQGSYDKHGDHLSLREPARAAAPRQFVGGIPGTVPPTLQAVHINDAAGLVDLAPLTAAGGLRRLHLNRSATADLAPVRDMPVESLRVTLAGADLAPLAGHAHLTALDLATTDPADLAPLRAVPHLRGLDLSAAEITDPAVLAGLADLRYLALNRRQWAALLDGAGLPPTLAAARLSDADATFDEALAWADRLGLDTAGPFRTSGSWRPA